ncbi:DUF305 domain-containing protein [Microbacterium aureliae]
MTDETVPSPRARAAASARPRWWIVALAALGIAALAFAVGRFSTFSSADALPPGTDSPEAGFSRDMQVHHGQAIQMAMEIYRKTEDEELRALSYDIATGQAGQRGEMYDWLVQWGLSQSGGPMMAWMSASAGDHGHGGGSAEAMSDDEAHAAMGMASAQELQSLADAAGTAADCLFLELMVRHHEGAIPMAEAVIDLGSEQRVRDVAASIVAGQSAEIDAMQSIQSRLGCGA